MHYIGHSDPDKIAFLISGGQGINPISDESIGLMVLTGRTMKLRIN